MKMKSLRVQNFQDELELPEELEEEVQPSKNSLFYEDFSVLPASKRAHRSSTEPKIELDSSQIDFQTEPKKLSKRNSLHGVLEKIITHESALQQVMESPSLRSLAVDFDNADEVKDDAHIKLMLLQTAKNKLGEGRFSQVYRGQYQLTSTYDVYDCAVKVLNLDDDSLECGLAEAYILKKIVRHPYIINLIGIKHEVVSALSPSKRRQSSRDVLTKQIMLLLEFCPLGNLYDYVLDHRFEVGQRRWINWSQQITGAVEFLHSACRGQISFAVQHHDIKPHNVMLNSKLECKLADFGNAVLVPLNKDSSLSDGLGRGTQAYTAPEILKGPDEFYGLSADIYSLGCTFYSMLFAREPFCEVRNAAHQLLCIRKGFFESGINPMHAAEFQLTTPQSAVYPSHSAPPYSPHQGSLSQRNIFSTPGTPTRFASPVESHFSSPVSAKSESPIFRFLNGEALYASLRSDSEAYAAIISLLHSCCSKEPQKRPSAKDLLTTLEQLDDLLIPSEHMDITSPARTPQLHSPSSVERISGGRKPLFL